MNDRILRLPDVIAMTGLSRSTLYARIAAGEFPAQLKLTQRAVGWRAQSVQDWIEKRKAANGGAK